VWPASTGICPSLSGEPCVLCQESDLLLYGLSYGGSRRERGGLFRPSNRYADKPILARLRRCPEWFDSFPVSTLSSPARRGPSSCAGPRSRPSGSQVMAESGRAVKMLKTGTSASSSRGRGRSLVPASTSTRTRSSDCRERWAIDLLNVLSGVVSADSGRFFTETGGSTEAPEATLLGFSCIEQALVPTILVYENPSCLTRNGPKDSHNKQAKDGPAVRRCRRLPAETASTDPRRLTGDYSFRSGRSSRSYTAHRRSSRHQDASDSSR
jgi:hypothetical protein